MISAVILTKNEQKKIEKCIQSLLWCDEVIVVDDDSIDKTIEIAKKLEATVFSHPLNNDFSSQRNFGLGKASGDWVLFIDADERVSQELQDEVKKVITQTKSDGFLIRRIDHVWETVLKHGETGNVYLLRLGKKDKGKWEGKVHEVWNVHGKIGMLKNQIEHYPFENVSEFLRKINYYTTIRAQELYEQKVHSSFFSILFYTKAKFIKNYFFKLGILDGIPGLVHALCMSFHSFLVRGKLWFLWDKK